MLTLQCWPGAVAVRHPPVSNSEYVTYRRSGPITSVGQPAEPAGCGVFDTGAKHVAETPDGRGPAVMYSLSVVGVRPVPSSSKNATVPSFGMRGSPLPPQTAFWSVVLSLVDCAMHGLLHVKPPFVD